MTVADFLPEIAAPTAPASVAAVPGKRTSKRQKATRIPRLKKWTVVSVKWLDAVLHEGPQNSDNVFEGCTRTSVGHFISRNKDVLTLAMEDDREDQDASDCDNATSIPLGMIRSVTVLIPKV